MCCPTCAPIGVSTLLDPQRETEATGHPVVDGPSTEWLELAEEHAAAAVFQTAAAANPMYHTQPSNHGQEARPSGERETLGSWFGPSGCKLRTAEWQRRGYDSAAIRNTADWMFNAMPTPSHHLENYPSIVPHKEAMGTYFDALLRTGVTEEYDPHIHGSEAEFATVINPLHVVIKTGGTMRPVIDPTRSGVNACMRPLPCPLPHLDTILQHLPPNGYLGKRDLASGFHHVKLAVSARRFIAFQHPVSHHLQRWVAMPFGASQSPAIFVELTDAARAIFQAECDARGLHVQIFVYVDDSCC